MPNRALVADPTHPTWMREADVTEPSPAGRQVVIDVHHASLNHGDLDDAVSAAYRREPSWVLTSQGSSRAPRPEAAVPASVPGR